MNRCIVCDKEFTAIKSTRKISSRVCYNKKSLDDKFDKMKRWGYIKCVKCKTYKEKTSDNFYIENGLPRGNKCITCFKAKKSTVHSIAYLQRIGRDLDVVEVGDFILDLKLKSYWADMIDIFRLIHYFDVLYPQSTLPDYLPERNFNIMFEKIAKWWVAQKK